MSTATTTEVEVVRDPEVIDGAMDEIIDLLESAIEERKESLVELRARILALVDPIPVGVVLSDEEGVVGHVASIHTGGSQWANCRWEVTLRGWGLVVDWPDGHLYMVCKDVPESKWDGDNMHYHHGEPYKSDGQVVRFLRGDLTRDVARRLPGAIARYIAECRRERAANDATIAEV
jgi:hypothetical protein